jgi:hypothetical protein
VKKRNHPDNDWITAITYQSLSEPHLTRQFCAMHAVPLEDRKLVDTLSDGLHDLTDQERARLLAIDPDRTEATRTTRSLQSQLQALSFSHSQLLVQARKQESRILQLAKEQARMRALGGTPPLRRGRPRLQHALGRRPPSDLRRPAARPFRQLARVGADGTTDEPLCSDASRRPAQHERWSLAVSSDSPGYRQKLRVAR